MLHGRNSVQTWKAGSLDWLIVEQLTYLSSTGPVGLSSLCNAVCRGLHARVLATETAIMCASKKGVPEAVVFTLTFVFTLLESLL